MKKFYFILTFLVIPILFWGQNNKDEITIGNGTSSSYRTPWNTYYNYSYCQLIYTSTEIGVGSSGALITSIKFYYNGYSNYTWDNMVIYMSHTDKSTFSSTSDWESYGNLVEVFNGSITVTQGDDSWVTITLDNPYFYNGTDNLLIAIDNNNGDYASLNAKFYSTSTSGAGYQVLYKYSDSSNPDPENPSSGTRDYSRSNIKINYIVDADPMEYSSCTTETASSSDVLLGSTDNEIIKLEVETIGYLSPLDATSITFNTSGSTNSSDITNAKVFVTSGDEFSTSNQFGSTITSPSGNMVFTGNTALGNGNTYFWLTFDIASGATLENVVDGQCTSITVDGTPRNPTVTNPSGSRTIDALKYAGGSGTEGDPYRIARLKDLAELCQDQPIWGVGGPETSLYYIITNDIDAAGTQYWDDSDDNNDGDLYNDPNDDTSDGTNDGWRPLGHTWGQYFMAAFDGQGYEIDGLYMNRDDSFDYGGFIGVTYPGDQYRRETGTIQNIGLTNINFTSQAGSLAGFIAQLNSDLIYNCYVSGEVNSETANVAGFVYRMQGQNADNHIISCYADVDVTFNGGSVYASAGGFAGYVQKVTGGDTKISKCFALGDVYNNGSGNTGGFCNFLASGTIEDCFYIGNVSADESYANIFIGYCASSSTYVENCFAVGNFNGTDSGSATNRGFGSSSTPNNNNFWDSDASNQLTANGADAKTTPAMKNQSTFTDAGWDFSSIWTIDPSVNDGYPYLIGMEPPLPTVIWDGSTNSDWNTASNWNTDAVPTSGDNAIIQNAGGVQPVLESGETADCYNLTVYSDATLTIESGGSLITAGNITNSGTINVEHSMTDGKWHLVSSPIYTKAGYIFEGDYLQYYDETLAENNYIEISDGNTYMTACRGYAWRNSAKSDFVFSGTPFTGNKSISTTAQQENGWNLVGNPYPSSLDWDLLDDTYGTVYTFVDNGINNGWRSYNNGAAVNGGSQYIPPMQGFFISTPEAGSFSVSNSYRTHNGANGYVKSKQRLNNFVKLQTNSESQYDETFIQFGNQYIIGFDRLHDAWKMNSESSESLMIFSKTTDGNLCIDRRPEVESIPLGFKNSNNAIASISVLEASDLIEITLEDTKLNTFHDLTQGAYNFDWQTTDSEERFILHLKATGTNDLEAKAAKVYGANSQIYVSQSGVNYNQMRVYDLSGRLVYQNQLNGSSLQSFSPRLISGVYLVELNGENGAESFKIVL